MEIHTHRPGLYAMTYQPTTDTALLGIQFDASRSHHGWSWAASAGVHRHGMIVGWLPCTGSRCALRDRAQLHTAVILVEQTLRSLTMIGRRVRHPLRQC
ncbi:hypothetical protein GZH49_06365 [Nocardia terpenica]|uniref:hypothetical protein n=1 Tax=Nocardia terpenica TaxID=455432 RepID=UPI002FE34F5D